jgi:hypothetical protein
MSNDITLEQKPVFYTTNDMEYANFLIDADQSRNGDYQVGVTVDSSFGAFAYRWNNIGKMHWADFLYNPTNMGYMMDKFLGDTGKEWDPVLTLKGMRREIATNKTYEWSTPTELTEARRELKSFTTDCGPDIFEQQLRDSDWFGIDSSEYMRYSDKPWVKNFWDSMWVPFTFKVKNTKEYRNAL